mgnify:CR=1 FL=1
MNNEGDFGQEKTKWEENLSASLSLKKEPSFAFFSVSSKEGKQTYWGGGPKNKTHRLLSLSHTFLLRKEPPSTTNDRFQSEWQIRIKALLPRMASNKRESVRFFTPPIIGLLLCVRERDKIYLIPLFRLFLSLSSSAPPPQPLSISRRRRAIPIAKEQTRKKSARARV